MIQNDILPGTWLYVFNLSYKKSMRESGYPDAGPKIEVKYKSELDFDSLRLPDPPIVLPREVLDVLDVRKPESVLDLVEGDSSDFPVDLSPRQLYELYIDDPGPVLHMLKGRHSKPGGIAVYRANRSVSLADMHRELDQWKLEDMIIDSLITHTPKNPTFEYFSVDADAKTISFANGDRGRLVDYGDLAEFKMLPTQGHGICYFHSVMNMMINMPRFSASMMAHLDRRIKASQFHRNQRGDRVLKVQITNNGRFDLKEKAEKIADEIVDYAMKTNVRDEMYEWMRDTVMLHAMQQARAQRGAQRVPGSKELDSVYGMVAKHTSDGARLGKQEYINFIEGDDASAAAARIFRDSGLAVDTLGENGVGSRTVFATIPGGLSITLVDQVHPYPLQRGFKIPDYGCDAASGMVMINYHKPRSEGHVMAFGREARDATPTILDSNLYTMTNFSETADRYRVRDPVNFCITTNAFVSEGARTATMTGGSSSSDAEAMVEDAMILTPASDVWDDDTVSTTDENTLAAFAVLARVLENGEGSEQRGGRGSMFIASHLALLAITVAAAIIQ